MYMNGEFYKLPIEEIQKKLDFCGLSEEELGKVVDELSHCSKQQYILEHNYLRTANNVMIWITVLLFVMIFYNLSNSRTALFTKSGVDLRVCHHLVLARDQHRYSVLRRHRTRRVAGGGQAARQVSAGSRSVPSDGREESHRSASDRTSGNRKDAPCKGCRWRGVGSVLLRSGIGV